MHTAKNHVYTDRVFVDIFHGFLRVKSVLALDGDRNKSHLYIEVASEFLKSYLSIGTHDNVGTRLVDRFSRCLAFLLPDTFHGQPSELNSLRRARCSGTHGIVVGRCVPKLGQYGNAYRSRVNSHRAKVSAVYPQRVWMS